MAYRLTGVFSTTLFGLMTIAGATGASATVFTGNLFYTKYSGTPNVWTVPYSYDDAIGGNAGLTLSESAATVIGTTNGADGIVFAPNGNLLIGGQTSNNIYEITTAGAPVGTTFVQQPTYHLTVDPNLTTVYTSDFGGNTLHKAALNASGNLTGSQTNLAISGDEAGITQVAFGGGNVYYVNGQPNGGGNLGLIDLTTGATDQFYTVVQSAHGIVYDPFTGKMTIFGRGWVGAFNADATLSGLTQFNTGVCDFDQGAVDGHGHAFVAGCDGMTFIDYSGSGDITNPNSVVFRNDGGSSNFNFIDDLSPLVGAGSQNNDVPEPGAMALFGIGLACLGLARRRRN